MQIILKNSDLPIYKKIYNEIKTKIIMGEIKEDEGLPSIRKLALDLGISVITVSRAYTDLEKDGYIITIPGKGCFINKLNKEKIKKNFIDKINRDIKKIVKNAKFINISKIEIIKILEEIYDKGE